MRFCSEHYANTYDDHKLHQCDRIYCGGAGPRKGNRGPWKCKRLTDTWDVNEQVTHVTISGGITVKRPWRMIEKRK
jgi:hypothetical protein